MQPALRLTSAPDLALHPEALFQQLETAFLPFDKLVEQLHCSVDALQQTLDAPETSQLLRTKTQVACLQVQLLALKLAPHCVTRLIYLSNHTDKPEVARRATTTLINLAGIATNTTSTPPAPAPVKAPQPKPAPEFTNDEMQELMMVTELALDLIKELPFRGCKALEPRMPELQKVLLDTIHSRFPKPPRNQPTPTPTTNPQAT